MSLADIVFESWDSFDSNKDGDVDENNNDNDGSSSEKCKAFWEEKDQLLKVHMVFLLTMNPSCIYTSTEY